MEEQEQVAESSLFDVFNMIKGPQNKRRAYVTINDFKAAIKKYKP